MYAIYTVQNKVSTRWRPDIVSGGQMPSVSYMAQENYRLQCIKHYPLLHHTTDF